MQIRCPHCQNGIELVDESDLQSVDCPSCGSQFGLVDVDQESIDTFDRAHAGNATIGHFELVNEVGRGAFGSVWQAHDSKLDRKVAIKVPRPGQFTQSNREQFLREARAAAQLNHPNIVSVYEVGLDDDRIYIVSDFVDGISLADLLSAERISARQAIGLCVKVVLALEHAHENGVIHRDLKPANIMLDENHEPFVMDFGLAKRDAGEITMTLDGKLLGTPAYMPPEQARGEGHHVDRRADVYSVGVILYELLTGELPFRGTTRMLLHQVIHEEAPSPRKLNSSIPRDLETITLKCLEKESGKRYETCAALGEDLQAWLDHKPIKARPTTWMERSWRWCKRKPAVAALSSGMLLVLLAASVISTVFGFSASHQARLTELQRTELQQKNQDLATGRFQVIQKNLDLADVTKQLLKQNINLAEANEVVNRQAYASAMALMRNDWNTGKYSRILKSLDNYRDYKSKGFEWYYWYRSAHQEILTLTSGENGREIVDVSFSPDGSQIAGSISLNYSRVPALWDLETGKQSLIESLIGGEKQQGYFKVGFSRDGKQIVTGSSNGTVLIVDVATRQETLSFKGHQDFVECVAFCPDGKRIVSAGRDKVIRVADASTGQEIFSLNNHQETVTRIQFSSDGTQVFSLSSDKIMSWNAKDGRILGQSDSVDGEWMAISPSGKYCVLVSDGKHIMRDRESGQDIWSTAKTTFYPGLYIFSPDGSQIAHAALGSITLLNSHTGQEISKFLGHSHLIFSICYSPDGSKLASSSADGHVKLWNTIPDICNVFKTKYTRDELFSLHDLTFSPDGSKIGVMFDTRDSDGRRGDKRIIQVWDVFTGDMQHGFQIPRGDNQRREFEFSQDGKNIIVHGISPSFWNVETGEEMQIHKTDVLSKTQARFRVFLAKSVKESKLFEKIVVPNFEKQYKGLLGGVDRLKAQVKERRFSPDGKKIAVRSADDTISIWDSVTGAKIATTQTFKSGFGIGDIAYCPDGTRLAVSNGFRTSELTLIDPDSGEEVFSKTVTNDAIRCVAFSPNGHLLATFSRDGIVRILDARPIKADATTKSNPH